MRWPSNSGIAQRVIQRHPNFARRNRAVQLFTIYEHRRRRVHSDALGLIHGGPNTFFILLLNASFKLIGVEVMPLSVDNGESVQFGVLPRRALSPCSLTARCRADNRHSPNKHPSDCDARQLALIAA